MTDTVAPEASASEPLSVDAAVGLLSTVQTEAVELPPEDGVPEGEEILAEPTAEEEPGAETPPEEPEVEQPEPAIPAIEPPQFWDAEAKAKFATFTPDQQHLVVEQVKAQNVAADAAIRTAAEARKTAEGQASKVTQLADHLNAFLPQAAQTFAGKWSNIDWIGLSKADPAKYVADRAQFEGERAQLQQVNAAAADANRLQFEQFVTAQAEALAKLAPEHAPELVDPKIAPVRRQELVKYLVDNGVPAAALQNISATETIIAHKAMMWDRAQAAAKKAAAAPKTPARAVAPVAPKPTGQVRPTAAQALAPSRQRTVEQAKANLDKSGSVDDAVTLLRSMRG